MTNTEHAKPELTDTQRRIVERAREVAAASAADLAPDEDSTMRFGIAFGAAKGNLTMLLQVIDELTGGTQ